MAVAFHLVAAWGAPSGCGRHSTPRAGRSSRVLRFPAANRGAIPSTFSSGVVEVEQGHDLHDPANADHQEAENQQQRGVAFNRAVFVKKSHFRALSLFSGHCGASSGRLALCRAGHSFPQVVAHDDRTGEEQRSAQATHHIHREFRGNRVCERSSRGNPCASTSRHIRPSMMPVTHMDGRIKHDADGCQPEVPADQTQAIQPFARATALAPDSKVRRK